MERIFKEELNVGEWMILYLGFSATVMRSRNHTLIIDPANLISESDLESIEFEKPVTTLYTHEHFDHYNESTLKQIYNHTQCYVVVEPTMTGKIARIIPREKLLAAEHEKPLSVGGIVITGIRGLHRGPITLYHIKTLDGTIFHGGDSAHIPLGKYSADIALTPTGDPSPTASPQDAYKMVIDLKPKIVLAIHGTTQQHQQLQNLIQKQYPQIKMIPLKERETYKIKL